MAEKEDYKYSTRVTELRKKLASYGTGSTIRFARQRPMDPPSHLRIGLFGPTGVGKSAFINSVNYATGDEWMHIAPEGFAEEASKTTKRNAHDIANHITIVDNRGMKSLGGSFMTELGHQLAGVYGDGLKVVWEKEFIENLIVAIQKLATSNFESQIHCAVLVLSAIGLNMRPADLKELISTIEKATGEPPVVVITHRNHPDVRDDVLSVFRTGLQEQCIDYVFEVENYTTSDHVYDAAKHLVLLEAIHQCAIVGDKVMKHMEDNNGKCVIL